MTNKEQLAKEIKLGFNNAVTKDKTAENMTPILNELKGKGINIVGIEKCLDDYEDLFVHMFECVCLQKRKTKLFPDMTKDQAYYEAQTVPRDVFKMIRDEINFESTMNQHKDSERAKKKKYTE